MKKTESYRNRVSHADDSFKHYFNAKSENHESLISSQGGLRAQKAVTIEEVVHGQKRDNSDNKGENMW